MSKPLGSVEEIEQVLRQALPHLYDPNYHPPVSLFQLFGHVPKQGTQVIQTALRQAIEELKPAANVPTDARVWRIYSVLYFRYVQHLTQEEAAHRLNITPPLPLPGMSGTTSADSLLPLPNVIVVGKEKS
jgi:hypothetical protein